MPFDLTKSLDSLPTDQRATAWDRVHAVFAAQLQLGMQPRNDSVLTFNYAVDNAEPGDSPIAIARELVVVNYIFQNTNYGAIVEEVLRALSNSVKSRYGLTWKQSWDIVRFYGPTIVKLYCVKHKPYAAS